METTKSASIEGILGGLQKDGIRSAVVRNDGLLLSSTLTLGKAGAGALASFSNVCDALLKTMQDAPREIEVTSGGNYVVIVPVGTYLLCGVLQDRDQKKLLRSYAEKLRLLV